MSLLSVVNKKVFLRMKDRHFDNLWAFHTHINFQSKAGFTAVRNNNLVNIDLMKKEMFLCGQAILRNTKNS